MKGISLIIKTASLLFVLACFLQAQTPEAVQADSRVNQIISDSERYFKQGELNLKDNRLPQAWEDFDKSVEVVLSSSINVRSSNKLNNYYLQLIGRIYQTELDVKKKPVQNKETKFEISSKCDERESKGGISETEIELARAINFYKKGNDDEAASKLRLILVSEPMSADAYLLLGKISFRRGDIDQTVSSLKTALFWDNRLIDAHILLGKIYLEKGDVLQAKNYSASALAIDFDNNRAQALSRLVEGRATSEDKRIIQDDSKEVEKLAQRLSPQASDGVNNYSNRVFVAPFQDGQGRDLLGGDFAYVLSEILFTENLCSVGNEDRGKLLEHFGFDTDETFTLATAIKFATASKSNFLVVGKYNRTHNYLSSNEIQTTTRIIRVNEGRFLSEDFADRNRRIDIVIRDSESNLRTMQGQIAYQVLYQNDKTLPHSQNELIERATTIKIPSKLNLAGSLSDEPDFSTNTSLKKTICDENVLGNLQLRNFRLGITFSEAAKILPKATVKNVNSYEKQMSQNFSLTLLKDERFKDINSIQLEFFDNRLYTIEILYNDNIKWQNLNEFASQVEKSLSLPVMKSGGYEFDGKYLYCGNYQIKAMLAKNTPAIHLFDTTVFNKINQRKQEEKNKALQQKIEEEKRKRQLEEEKKKVFKP